MDTETANIVCMTRLELIATKHLMPDVMLCSSAGFEAARYTCWQESGDCIFYSTLRKQNESLIFSADTLPVLHGRQSKGAVRSRETCAFHGMASNTEAELVLSCQQDTTINAHNGYSRSYVEGLL